MPYNTKQDAVTALLPGYHVVGEAPYVVKVANPQAGIAGQPAQIDQEQGTTLSVQGPNGEPDTIVVKQVGNNNAVKGGVGYDVITGPTKAPTKTATAPGDWTRLDANGKAIPASDTTTTAVYLQDPKAAPGTQPFKIEASSKLGDPSTWTPIYRTPGDASSGVIGLYDPKAQAVAASVSAEPNAKPSGVFTNVTDPNDPAGKRVIGLVDTGDKSLHAVSTQADGKQLVTTTEGIYSYDKDADKVTLLQKLDKTSPLQIVTYPDGTMYTFNPNDGTLNPVGPGGPPKTITENGTTYLYNADKGTYELPPGVTKPTTVDNTTTLRRIVIRDDQGNVISDTPNVNYQPPAATVPAANTTAPFIQVQDPNDPSKLIWVENKGRVTASDALKNLASSLTGQVVSGDLSVDEAKALIDAANAKMTADTNKQNAQTSEDTNIRGAAGDILANTRGNAQTGAGLLNNRVTAATGLLNNVLGLAGGGQRSGNMGGGLMSAPAGLGESLVGGIQGWTADLMGGQATLDSAARLVQMADPKSDMADPATQHAIGVLSLMLDKYHDTTGQYHPAVQASLAAQQGAAGGGMAAPLTIAGNAQGQATNAPVRNPALDAANVNTPGGYNPQGSTAALNAQGLLDTPQGRAVAAGQTPVAAGGATRYPGQYDPAWSQAIRSPVGSISTGPNAANGFVAPPMAPPKAAPTIVINAA